MQAAGLLSRAALEIDAEQVTAQIVHDLREVVHGELRRRGGVVAVSGGIDSAVVVALCARALGPEAVLAVLMPERDSAGDTLALSRLVADSVGVPSLVEEISEPLEAIGCYRRRDEAIRAALPEYTPEWGIKIVLPGLLGSDRLRLFSLVARPPGGEERTVRLPAAAYSAIVAATNFKQRTRKMLEYFHADRLGYAVVGTPNRLEHDQGFFVKGGDGLADVKPIAHLYKTQVYRLAEHLGIPAEIRERPPTTDTYSLPQSQSEFFFSIDHETLDLCLYARNEGLSPEAVAPAVGLSAEDVRRVFDDIDGKRRATRYLHLPARLLAGPGAAAPGAIGEAGAASGAQPSP